MPESAEIQITVDELNKYLKGAELLKVIPSPDSRYKKTNFNIPQVKINSIGKKGKFIYWVLDNGQYIFNTLGLSGHWSLTKQPNTSLEVQYKKNGNIHSLYLIDQLHFATFGLHDNLESKLKSIGPDISDATFDIFKSQMNKYPNLAVGDALLNQKIVSGVGNYIRAEALYIAKISPFRKIKDISESELELLYKAIKFIVRKSYENGGASVTFFKDIKGQTGNFENYFAVYGKKMDKKGNPVSADKLDDRTIYWVPAIQK